jgi:hypothetical protein
MMYSRTFGKTYTTADWREAVKTITKANNEYQAYASMMSQYERMTVSKGIAEKITQYRPLIEAGVIGEFNQAISAFKQARSRVDQEKAKEIIRWDVGKLRDEIQLANLRIDTAFADENPVASISLIYQEAKNSGDIHKMRAAAEAVRGAVLRFPNAPLEIRTAANGAAKQADRELAELRNTPGLEQAHKDAGAAFDALMAKQREMLQVEEAIGGSHAIYMAAAKVTIDRDTGKINIPE